MIEIQNVTKRYGEFVAVRDVSFSVDRGEIIGLVGPNGAGKTTMMKMITGYLVADEGRVTVGGADVASNPERAQARIGYLPEHNPLYPEMVVQDYLVFIAKMRGLRGDALTNRLRTAVDACNLREVLTKRISQLSKGFRQRVGIAQAMIHDPDILILDEPTSGLDPNQIIEIRDLIRDLGRDKTVILSTHILSEVAESCSRAIMIVGGRLAVDDRVETLLGGRLVRFRFESTESEEACAAKIADVEGIRLANAHAATSTATVRSFEVEPLDDRGVTPALHQLAVEQGWRVHELTVARRNLEDVFREAGSRPRVDEVSPASSEEVAS